MRITERELEQSLGQRVRCFYEVQLERQPHQVKCQISGNKVFILLEDALTFPEMLLINQGYKPLASQVREQLHQILKPHLKALIESVMQMAVADISLAAQLDEGCVSCLATLAESLPHQAEVFEEAG